LEEEKERGEAYILPLFTIMISIRYLDWLAEELDIRTREDWYYVTGGEIERFGGHTLLKMEGGIYNVLKKYRGIEVARNPRKRLKLNGSHSRRVMTKGQGSLIKALKRLFPGNDMLFDYRFVHLPTFDIEISFLFAGIQS
jgi:hypothetical protein